MPLYIEHVETKDRFDSPVPEAHDHNVRVTRRVFCDGCHTGNTYPPDKWVFFPDQVASWFEEHKDHGEPKGKKK